MHCKEIAKIFFFIIFMCIMGRTNSVLKKKRDDLFVILLYVYIIYDKGWRVFKRNIKQLIFTHIIYKIQRMIIYNMT